ncbi:MAG: hypothetical protein GX458_20840 [Phyllobacteriaceae bacterium]|nr:hypothetical protein [Phyllobacteriaceae bacterium]
MSRLLARLALVAGLLAAGPASAQTTGTPADHDALRRLMADAVRVVDDRDYATARRILAEPFVSTIETQQTFTDFEKLKAAFEDLYTRPVLRMKTIRFAAEADDFARIREGRYAIAQGPTREHFELADGRTFDVAGRWTAVASEENGAWKIEAIHMGVNYLDNPVLAAIEKSVVWFAAGGVALGVVLGFIGGWVFGRRRRAA